MKLSKNHESIERKNSAMFTAIEHTIQDEAINSVIVKLSGRYPEKQRAVNQQCKEIIYVQDGEGKLILEDQVYELNAGDMVLIEPGEKYYWQGNMRLFVACSPAWTKEQHQIVD